MTPYLNLGVSDTNLCVKCFTCKKFLFFFSIYERLFLTTFMFRTMKSIIYFSVIQPGKVFIMVNIFREIKMIEYMRVAVMLKHPTKSSTYRKC